MWQTINADSGKSFLIKNNDWPILVHGAAKSGASFFTVVMTAELLRAGAKAVFICAKGEAVRALQAEMGEAKPAAKFKQVDRAAMAQLEDMQLVTFFNKSSDFLLRNLRALADWDERIVVVKNFETIMDSAMWAVLRAHKKLIVAGDATRSRVPLAPTMFNTTIAFSPWPEKWNNKRAQLPSYIGAVQQNGRNFHVIVQEKV